MGMDVAGGSWSPIEPGQPAGRALTQLAGHNITAGCWHLPPSQVVISRRESKKMPLSYRKKEIK